MTSNSKPTSTIKNTETLQGTQDIDGHPTPTMEEQEALQEIKAIDDHLRSLSSLGYALTRGCLYVPKLTTVSNPSRHLLNNLLDAFSQCLIREPLETAAVAALVAEKHLKTVHTHDDPESFDRLHSAIDVHGAGDQISMPEEGSMMQEKVEKMICESLGEKELFGAKHGAENHPTVAKLVFEYRSYTNTTRQRASLYPNFTFHAETTFFFLKEVLKERPEEQNHLSREELKLRFARRTRSFLVWVVGMSLAKLGKRLEDPPTLPKHSINAFLSISSDPKDFIIPEGLKNISFNGLQKLCLQFKMIWKILDEEEKKSYCELEKIITSIKEKLTVDAKISLALTPQLAACCHLVLGTHVRRIREVYNQFEEWRPSHQPSEDQIENCQKNLRALSNALDGIYVLVHSDVITGFCKSISKDLIDDTSFNKTKGDEKQAYCGPETDEEPVSSYSSPKSPNSVRESSWQALFINWLKRLIRHYSCCLTLVRQKDPLIKRLASIKMDVITRGHLKGKYMQPWIEMLKEVATQESSRENYQGTCETAIGNLALIELEPNGKQGNLWPLVRVHGQTWETSFEGSCHCEAVLAVTFALTQQKLDRGPIWGISKPCCAICSIFLKEIIWFYFRKPAFSAEIFWRESHKFYQWALPSNFYDLPDIRNLPLEVARSVSKKADALMLRILRLSRDNIREEASAYLGEDDDPEGLSDWEDDDVPLLPPSVNSKLDMGSRGQGFGHIVRNS